MVIVRFFNVKRAEVRNGERRWTVVHCYRAWIIQKDVTQKVPGVLSCAKRINEVGTAFDRLMLTEPVKGNGIVPMPDPFFSYPAYITAKIVALSPLAPII